MFGGQGGGPPNAKIFGGQPSGPQNTLSLSQGIGSHSGRHSFNQGGGRHHHTGIMGAPSILQAARENTAHQQNMMATRYQVKRGVDNGTRRSTNYKDLAQHSQQNTKLFQLVMALTSVEKREQALLSLSKKREAFPDLAPILWHSVGVIAALLQEIVSIYPCLQSANLLTGAASNRCCNALALLQCVASHSDTKSLFLNAHIPLFLYPFLNTTHTQRPFEYLRLTSLGVIGALVKMDDPEVINFLLQTEIIPLCLRIMETGSELSKTVATFIVQKILLDDSGLNYICATAERFYTVSGVFNNMVQTLVTTPSVRLLKHIVRCYLRMTDNSRAREALRLCLPTALQSPQAFAEHLKDDVATRRWLEQLRNNLYGGQMESVPAQQQWMGRQ